MGNGGQGRWGRTNAGSGRYIVLSSAHCVFLLPRTVTPRTLVSKHQYHFGPTWSWFPYTLDGPHIYAGHGGGGKGTNRGGIRCCKHVRFHPDPAPYHPRTAPCPVGLTLSKRASVA